MAAGLKRWGWVLGGLVGLGLLLGACSPAAQPTPAVSEAPVVTQVVKETVLVPATPTSVVAEATPGPPLPTSTPSGGDSTAATPTPLGTPAPTALPESTSSAKPIAEVRVVEVEYPPQLRLGDSDLVRLALIPFSEGYTLTTEFEGNQTVTQTVEVLPRAGYDAWGVAWLDAVNFEFAPSGEQAQLLSSGVPAVWRWSLRPLSAGQQRFTLRLYLRWLTQAAQPTLPDTLLFSRGFTVQVRSLLGLTTREVTLLGFFGLALGTAFSVPWAWQHWRGAARRLWQRVQPNAQLEIEAPPGLQLSPAEKTLLQALFHQYARLVLAAEFRSGYSGARTLLARPVLADGRADAHTIAKLGDANAIAQEYANYEQYVKHTLPPITARIQDVPRRPWLGDQAALRYTFIGAPGETPHSLGQALRTNPDPAWLTQLFNTFGPNWWLQRRPYTFRAAQEYDRGLPAHWVLAPATGTPAQVLDGRTAPSQALTLGTLVQLRHWRVVERRPDGASLSLAGEAPPGHPPVRARWLSLAAPEGAVARVVATRETLLREYAVGADLMGRPDPLPLLPVLLNELVTGTRSIIHGDLHLENILVGPGGFVWLIDFAQTREGHTLFDFAHLHASILAQVLVPTAPTAEAFLAACRTHPLPITLTALAHRCLFNPGYPREYTLALALTCLGALKYANLTPLQKQRLYLFAAESLRPPLTPMGAN